MRHALQHSYDLVAAEYSRRLYDELSHKPFDRKMLDWLHEFAGSTVGICDLGCGPGHVARYLRDRGAQVCGIDLSTAMVEQARALSPDISFQQGDMTALTGVPDASFGAIAAFYSIINLPRPAVAAALHEMWRVLQPDGVLLLTFHIGTETRHFDTLWDIPVNLDFHFYETSPVKTQLRTAGFTILESIERDPYPPEVEVQTRRAYLIARKAPAPAPSAGITP